MDKDSIQKWAAASLALAETKTQYEIAKRAYEAQVSVVESYRRELSGVGANVREKFVRIVVDGDAVLVHLQWIPGTEDPRREDRIEARIVEVE